MKNTSLEVVGIGSGSQEGMTIEARNILKDCDTIFGYTRYIDLVKDFFPDKEMIATGMKKEQQRCYMALEAAVSGKKAAMVCSGDSGIYGMASLLYEIAEEEKKFQNIEIHVVAGVTAAVSGGAILGAPLSHDFAVISMSDLLTPLSLIKKRLQAAAEGDFVICLYNPSSKNRKDYLKIACEEILKSQSPETICGYVRNIGREGEEAKVMTLKELKDTQVDMFTTVFIGNSSTRNIQGKMVTPRGYQS